MRPTDALFSLAATLAAGALAPVAYMVLRQLRERKRRAAAALRLGRVSQARDRQDLGAARAELNGLDAESIDHVLDQLSCDLAGDQQRWLAQLAGEVGAIARYCERARRGATWNDRAFAVRLLGRLGAPAAAEALSEVVRDRTEDEVVRSMAADALAAIRDPAVIPLLIGELRVVDEKSTPRAAEALIRFGSLATPALIEALSGKEQGMARLWAARILTVTRDAAAYDALLDALRDRLDLVRVASADALGSIGDSRALAPLMQAALRDPAPLVRSQAAVAAAKLSGPDAANVLLSALRDPDYATRLRALEAFESMQLAELTPLETALTDDNVEVQRRAALALERSGYLERIVEQLGAADRKQRTAAYAKLLQLGRAGLTDSITGRLRHESMAVRVAIARACAELRAARAGTGLIAALDDPAWPVRAAACEAIEQLQPKGAARALLNLLADPEESVREAAASALTVYPPGELETSEEQLRMAYDNGSVPIRLAVLSLWAGRVEGKHPLLVEALRDPSEAVRLRAIGALSQHPDPNATPALIAALTDASVAVRTAAVPALGAAGTAEAFEALLGALAGASPALREHIAEALSSVGKKHLLHNLAELSRSAAVDVRLGIAWTLGKIGDPSCVPVLEAFLRDKDPRLRASAAGALGKVAGGGTLKALVAASGDPDPKTRAAVVNALGKCAAADGGSVRGVLEERMRDPDGFVRNRAAIALARTSGAAVEALASAPETASLLDAPALVIMQGLVGTAKTVTHALQALADPAQLPAIKRFVEREEPAVLSAFLAALKLHDPQGDSAPLQLEPDVLVDRYERLLSMSQDETSRRAAVEALASLREAPPVAALSAALGADPDEAVRLRCSEILGRHVDDPVARAALTRAVADPSAQVAVSAVAALRGRREPAVVSALFKRLGAGSTLVNEAVEQALAELYRDELTSFVDRSLGAERTAVIAASVRVLERMADPRSAPLLERMLKARDPEVRAASVRALASTSPQTAAQSLQSMVDDPNELVRVAAFEVLAASGPDALPSLLQARSDPAVVVRRRLCQVLDRFEYAVAAPALEGLCDDAAPRVHASALISLASFATRESLQRFAARSALASEEVLQELRLEPRAQSVAHKLGKLLIAGGDATLREVAAGALAALATLGHEQLLLPALRDPRGSVRLAAARALADSAAPDVQERLGELVDDPDAAVRDAVRALRRAS